MFSSAVSVGTRLNDWNTKPIRSRRSRVSSLSLERGELARRRCITWPEVRVSRPAQQCISVDLPDPDGPMIAVNSPASKST